MFPNKYNCKKLDWQKEKLANNIKLKQDYYQRIILPIICSVLRNLSSDISQIFMLHSIQNIGKNER